MIDQGRPPAAAAQTPRSGFEADANATAIARFKDSRDIEGGVSEYVAAVQRIEAVPTLLQVLCETTGMGFAAVARVTDESWTACAVHDSINFGVMTGHQLDVNTTLCVEVKGRLDAIVIDHVSTDPIYSQHRTPKLYGFESYVSVPIVLPSGSYFGNLCAIDRKPAHVSQPQIVSMFRRFAHLIALQLEGDAVHARANAELLDERAASELREQFIAILGHDLRNPLQAFFAGCDLLARQHSEPATLTLVARMKANAQRMSALINDTLDFARGRLGSGIGVKIESVDDVGAALEDVVRELQMSRPERLIIADIKVGQPVRCDVRRIQQVASNLIGNALTHGDAAAPVRFSAGIEGDQLLIDVVNEGDPIPAESLGKIFSPFWRRSTSASRDGLGLGLYICSQIIDAHGGRLTVTSTRECGTRFSVRVPRFN